MRSFIELVVKKPVAVCMGIVAIVILGIVSLSRLPVDFLPNMELPFISVRTTYDNAGPEEVEKSVTRLIESAVSGINNVKTITSSSREEISSVFIEFNWGSDLSSATADIREALDRIRSSLPDDAESPAVYKFSTDNIPVMAIAFYGTENLSALYDLVDNQILNRIKQVGGVAMAEIWGGLKTQIKVDVDMNRLQAYGLDINTIVSTLARENQNLAGGETYEGVYKYTLRTTGEFKTVSDIGTVVVALKENNTPIRLRDIANIYEGYDENMDIVKVNGAPAVNISINKESGANTVGVSDAIKKQLNNLNLPEGIKYEILFNTADTVNNSIAGVLDAAWQGGLFAVIILMIYLWKFRTVAIIAISIPMSIIITFTLMYFMGITLNIISLSGSFLVFFGLWGALSHRGDLMRVLLALQLVFLGSLFNFSMGSALFFEPSGLIFALFTACLTGLQIASAMAIFLLYFKKSGFRLSISKADNPAMHDKITAANTITHSP